jgi:hypothetical protein
MEVISKPNKALHNGRAPVSAGVEPVGKVIWGNFAVNKIK